MFDISSISLFSTLSKEESKELSHYIITETYKKKDVIFSEGDPPEWFYVVAEGKVKITKVSHEGKELILEIIPPNDIFGGIAVIKGFPYPANAVAMEDTKIIKLSRSDLMKIIDRFPTVMFCIAQSIGDRVKVSHETLKNIALERIEARIASLLLKLADKTGEKTPDGLSIEIKLTRQDISEMVGTTVETTIRTMSKFKKMGIISEKTGNIIIKDIKKLRKVIDPSEGL